MDREMKITKCGEWAGSLFKDRVSIEFSPSELETLKQVYEQRALNATRYNEQGAERDMCEVFGKAYGIWQKARKERKKA